MAKAGYPVFPSKDKEPTVEGGFYACTTDVSQVAEWITEGREHHDVAVATGLVSGVVVIDADTPETFEEMRARYGEPDALTRRGGHWWYAHPRKGKITSTKVRDGLDRKGDGGYVAVPPSRGRTWTRGIPDKASLPTLPREFWPKRAEKSDAERSLSAYLKDQAAETIADYVANIPPGEGEGKGRHEHLKHLCGVLLARGVAFGDAEDVLIAAWSKADGELAERAPREVPNTLRTTEQALAEDRATGKPSLERVTPGLYDELEEVFGWKKIRLIHGGRGQNRRGPGGSATDVSDVSDVSSKQETFIHPGEFPVDALPEECANYVREAAESLLCPPELVGLPSLCAMSAAIGHSRALRIKPGWTVSGNLYAVVVDWPGSRKSPAAAFAYKPLHKLQAELRKDYKEAKKDYEKEMRQHAVDKKLAAKDNKAEPEPPARPTMKRCIVDDITVEALAGRVEENPRGLLSAQDELTGFIRGMDQYKSGGKGNTRQTYLKIWSNQPIIVDRKGGEEPVVIPNPYVTLQGSIQPGVLDEIADGRDDGFLDRWLFAYPESRQGGYSDSYVSNAAELAYERTIKALWNKEPLEESEDGYEPRVIQMSEEAKELFKAEANGLREEMYAPGFPEVMRGAWAKFDLLLARLALILAVTRQAHEEREEVSEEDMRNALALLSYFKDSARKVYGQLFEANPDDILATDLKTFLTKAGYVFSGTLSSLRDSLKSRAYPKTNEGAGRALRRIAESTPGLSLSSKSNGKNRIITLELEKPSEPSEPSSGGSSYADLGADLGGV